MKAIQSFADKHPRLTAWIALAIGMVIILLWASKDVGLLPTQLLALAVATVLLAGLCVWIIGWEDEDETPSVDEGRKTEERPNEPKGQMSQTSQKAK